MTNRDHQHRFDRLAMVYLTAIDDGDFDTLDRLWEQAAHDRDLAEMLHSLHDELVAERDAADQAAASEAVVAVIEQHMPSAEVIRPVTGPLTVAEVAEQIRRHPPRGLTVDDLKLNDVLLRSAEVVPIDLGLTAVGAWGKQFGSAPEVYWRAFRDAALTLRMRRESPANHKMAARPTRPKPPGGKP